MQNGHCLHWYYGDGKGKTTAAMGLAFRALGHGQRVLTAQFMKKGDSGELTALRAFPGALCLLAQPMEGFTFQMNEKQLAKTVMDQQALVEQIHQALPVHRPRLIVLDELGTALAVGLLQQETVMALVGECLCWGETVLTGGRPTGQWPDKADYLSEICSKKHPYDAGVQACQGVEW